VVGSGTYVYPLRAGEDQLVQTFLVQAAFPPLSETPVVALSIRVDRHDWNEGIWIPWWRTLRGR
jgi:hypothetical protein